MANEGRLIPYYLCKSTLESIFGLSISQYRVYMQEIVGQLVQIKFTLQQKKSKHWQHYWVDCLSEAGKMVLNGYVRLFHLNQHIL